jgi:23S rRNA (uracil1939-C5)-methyltransferase
MLSRGESLIVNEVRIEKWVYGGDALARLDGVVVLAPYLLPGERARIRTKPVRTGLLRGEAVELLEPSAERVEPRCPYFGDCGGCHYQHASYESQLRHKVEILRESLARIGRVEAPGDIDVIAAEPWGYRNRIQIHFDGGRAGFRQAGSHRVVSVEQCPVASPRLNETLATLRRMTRDRRFPEFLRTLELFANEAEVQLNVLNSGPRRLARGFFAWCAEEIPGAMQPAIDYGAAGETFRVSHKSFFQVNRFLVDQLVETVCRDASGGTALDLYAGVGLFSIPLARRFEAVAAVETAGSAVADLEHNAQRAGVAVPVHRKAVEEFLPTLSGPPDFCVADPPRSGLGRKVVEQLLRIRPPWLVVVSCDPATLARDLHGLQAVYEIRRLAMADLFPQTSHIEAIVELRLR